MHWPSLSEELFSETEPDDGIGSWLVCTEGICIGSGGFSSLEKSVLINSEQIGALRRFLNDECRAVCVPLGLTMALRSFLFFEQLGDAFGDVLLLLPLGTASTEGTDVADTEVPLPLSEELFARVECFRYRFDVECFLLFTFERFFSSLLRRLEEDLRVGRKFDRLDLFLRIFLGGLVDWKSLSLSAELELIEELRQEALLMLLLLAEPEVELWSLQSPLLPVDDALDLRLVLLRLRGLIAGWPRMLNFTSS